MQCTLHWASTSPRHQRVFAHLQCGQWHTVPCIFALWVFIFLALKWSHGSRQFATILSLPAELEQLFASFRPVTGQDNSRSFVASRPLFWPLVVLDDHSLLAGPLSAPFDGLPLPSFDVWMSCRKLSLLKFWSSSSAHLSRSRSSGAC